MSTADKPPGDLAIFIDVGEDVERGLIVLSVAVSLTDELAIDLLAFADVDCRVSLISALHACDLVVEGDTEWNLAPLAREYLHRRLTERNDLFRAVHGQLLNIVLSPILQRQFSQIPGYLIEGPGLAYHQAALDGDAGLKAYTALVFSAAPNAQWLGSLLAKEQQSSGILAVDALEVDFLCGIVLYREGRIAESIPLLDRVATGPEDCIEVAISMLLVARFQGLGGEHMLRRSLALGEQLNDDWHIAQVLHTLGVLIGRKLESPPEDESRFRWDAKSKTFSKVYQPRRDSKGRQPILFSEVDALVHLGLGKIEQWSKEFLEAESLLRRSFEIMQARGEINGQARALHSLGKLIGLNLTRSRDTRTLLDLSLVRNRKRRQLTIRLQAHVFDRWTVADYVKRSRNREVLPASNSDSTEPVRFLAAMVNDFRDAEALLKRSLDICKRQNDEWAMAQVMQTLGELVGHDSMRAGEAETLLKCSLGIGERLNNELHMAQVMHTLGALIGHNSMRIGEAE